MRVTRLLFVLLMALSAFSPLGTGHAATASVQVTKETKDCTVYATRTGARYHKAYCSSLRRSKIPMSRSEAIKAGLTPCRRCGGSDCEE